jgi:hypothetical protein
MVNKALFLYRDLKYRAYRTKSGDENFNLSLFLRIWVSDRLLKLSPIKASLPWMPYNTILILHNIIKKDFNILETGSGGSSLFFLKRCRTLTSLEHHAKWIKELKKIQSSNYKNRWTLALKDLKNDTLNKSPYLDFLTTQKDEYFDLISIDGRLRNESLKIASRKVKKGGFILLDNSDRNDYEEGIEFINNLGWSRQDLQGFCYSLEWDVKSTIWQKN